MSYFEPEGVPQEVIQSKTQQKRVIRIRFQSKEDVDAFIEKTGIQLPHRSIYKISYPERDIFSFLGE